MPIGPAKIIGLSLHRNELIDLDLFVVQAGYLGSQRAELILRIADRRPKRRRNRGAYGDIDRLSCHDATPFQLWTASVPSTEIPSARPFQEREFQTGTSACRGPVP